MSDHADTIRTEAFWTAEATREQLLAERAFLCDERERLTAERQQAIDALREIEHWPYSVMEDAESDVQAMKGRARAVLLNLGETE